MIFFVGILGKDRLRNSNREFSDLTPTSVECVSVMEVVSVAKEVVSGLMFLIHFCNVSVDVFHRYHCRCSKYMLSGIKLCQVSVCG